MRAALFAVGCMPLLYRVSSIAMQAPTDRSSLLFHARSTRRLRHPMPNAPSLLKLSGTRMPDWPDAYSRVPNISPTESGTASRRPYSHLDSQIGRSNSLPRREELLSLHPPNKGNLLRRTPTARG